MTLNTRARQGFLIIIIYPFLCKVGHTLTFPSMALPIGLFYFSVPSDGAKTYRSIWSEVPQPSGLREFAVRIHAGPPHGDAWERPGVPRNVAVSCPKRQSISRSRPTGQCLQGPHTLLWLEKDASDL